MVLALMRNALHHRRQGKKSSTMASSASPSKVIATPMAASLVDEAVPRQAEYRKCWHLHRMV